MTQARAGEAPFGTLRLEHASTVELKPVKLTGTMAFMFETRFPQRVTRYAAEAPELQERYIDCWKGLRKHFDPGRP